LIDGRPGHARPGRLVAVVMALAVVSAGCATLFAGGAAPVPVQTNPPGAVVYLNGQAVGQTPTMVVLDRTQPANLQIYLPGFRPVQMWRAKGYTGWFWVNLLFWPGFLVDLATGAYEQYDDTGVAIGLVPDQGPPPPWAQQPQPPQPQPDPNYPPIYQQPPRPPGPAPVQPGMGPAPYQPGPPPQR
jgi:hypothetical protein